MGRPLVDLTGMRFGRLKVEHRASDKILPSGVHAVMYHCKCDCGNKIDVNAGSLKSGKTKSCGCFNRDVVRARTSKNLKEQRFGRLVAIEPVDIILSSGKHKQEWLCQCDCGNKTIVSTNNLLRGHSKSCGCYKHDVARERMSVNLLGQTFGYLTVEEKIVNVDESTKKTQVLWKCKCKCGNDTLVPSDKLTGGITKSCGCYMKERIHDANFQNLQGNRYGILTVTSDYYIKKRKNGTQSTYWRCKCDCGNEVAVWAADLKNNHVKSCGCLKMSIGELYVKEVAEDMHMFIESQVSFENLVGCGGRLLSYDFAIYSDLQKTNLKALIECQGQQHYNPVNYFGGKQSYEIQTEHDRRKADYAMNNLKVRFLEIPYTYGRDEIAEILEQLNKEINYE